MTTETLFSSYQPIEQYLKLIHATHQGNVTAALDIKAIDAFLMKQMSAYYPVEPTIIDLAAEVTLGASTIFWLAHPGIQQVIAPHRDDANPDWVPWVQGAQKSMELNDNLVILPQAGLDPANGWAVIKSHLNPLSPPIFVLAISDTRAGGVKATIESLLTLVAEPVIFLAPIGAIGQSSLLEVALSVCSLDTPYQLTVMRDISFFFAASQLGLIYKRDNHFMPDMLNRIRQPYEGNFDLLSMLEQSIGWQVANQSEKVAQIQQDMPLIVPPPYPEPLLTGRLIQRGYRTLVPSGARQHIWDWSVSMTAGLRNYYYKTIPLKTRIALRDIRVLLIGR
jgi:hypothetical protein